MNGCSLQYIEEYNQSYLASCTSLKDNIENKQYLQIELTSRAHDKTSLSFFFGLGSYISNE